MPFQFTPPIDTPAWYRHIEQGLNQRHVDIQRLWLMIPQIPDLTPGIPFTGPTTPDRFSSPGSKSSNNRSSSSYSSRSSSSRSSSSSSSRSSSSVSSGSSSSSSLTCSGECIAYWQSGQWVSDDCNSPCVCGGFDTSPGLFEGDARFGACQQSSSSSASSRSASSGSSASSSRSSGSSSPSSSISSVSASSQSSSSLTCGGECIAYWTNGSWVSDDCNSPCVCGGFDTSPGLFEGDARFGSCQASSSSSQSSQSSRSSSSQSSGSSSSRSSSSQSSGSSSSQSASSGSSGSSSSLTCSGECVVIWNGSRWVDDGDCTSPCVCTGFDSSPGLFEHEARFGSCQRSSVSSSSGSSRSSASSGSSSSGSSRSSSSRSSTSSSSGSSLPCGGTTCTYLYTGGNWSLFSDDCSGVLCFCAGIPTDPGFEGETRQRNCVQM